MGKKIEHQQRYYFSDKLKRQLALIAHHPLTIVEAPSGFGKTTVIREYLKENLPQGACEYWYTCFGEPAFMAWLGICELFENINAKAANDMKNLKMPTWDTLFYITAYLRELNCQTETYLVMDNYQLVNCEIPRDLINVFAMHGNPNLHLIIITQQLEARQHISVHHHLIHKIGASAFFFDREGTASLFRMEGIRLSDTELESIYRNTEGWISALCLQMMNYKETGSFDYTADIEQLVEKAIWNRLSTDEKDFLLSVSVMESFTYNQAAILIGQDRLPDNLADLLKSNVFIRYLPDKGQFTIHSILLDYLRTRFYHYQSQDYQHQVLKKAGHAHAAFSQYRSATHFFYQVKDFEAILSLPFSREYLDNQKEKLQSELIVAIVNECPVEILCKYPFTMIVLGYYTLMNGQHDAYHRLCQLLDHVVQTSNGMQTEELRRAHGEYVLLVALGEFNHVSRIVEGQKKAWDILGKPSEMIKLNTPWLFATTSVLNMFWRKSGELDNTVEQMFEGMSFYHRLARGHGDGARFVIRAEALLMRGEDEKAEIMCHKALYDANSSHQTGICLCAELVLARIAILRGNQEGYFNAIKNIQGFAKENSDLYVLRMVEHCMSIISLVLGVKDDVASWLYDMENIKKVLYNPVVPMAQLLHLTLLLLDKRYNEFYGICQQALEASRCPTGNMQYMMPQVYQLILLALAKRNQGHPLEARAYLMEALELALPDRIYLPFAQQDDMREFLSELSMHAFETTKNNEVTNHFDALRSLCQRQKKGEAMIKKALHQAKSPLTPREREIAQLAKSRFSAKEIAERLFISEMTVRATLRSVYRKLDVHSKGELSAKDF